MRSGVSQASNAEGTAASTGATLGGEAQGIGSNVTPFLTQEMLNPQGVGQTGLSAETAAALGGAGGANAGLVGQANQRAAVSRNAGGFQAALDDASRNRSKAAADSSEGITGQNETLKTQQQQQGASGLEHMYGVDTSGMLQSQGQEANDIDAEANANKTGWLQNASSLIGDATGIAKLGAGFGIPGFQGFKGGGGGGN
jgi:hypothetical protein